MLVSQNEHIVQQLSDVDYSIYHFNREEVILKTKKKPKWIHLGAGNIFRIFLGSAQQQLINQGIEETGIIIAEGYDLEIIDFLKKWSGLTIGVTLKNNGTVEKKLIGSMIDFLKMSQGETDFELLKEYFRAPDLQMVTMTITEKGYQLKDNEGSYFKWILEDMKSGPKGTNSYLGNLVSLCYERFIAGQLPFSLVSLDNMSTNGKKLEDAVLDIAQKWVDNDLVSEKFINYLTNRKLVTFPWTMIDKITPRPNEIIQKLLEQDGLKDMEVVKTEKQSFIAPFVNAEELEYLVIEDDFPNGRPQLEKAGIIFTNRMKVNQIETMKVTSCLNPLHTALAIFGCLFGYSYIHETMKDDDLLKLVKILGYKEGLSVIDDPKIIHPKNFIDEVINIRLPNPFIPDTPQRIATDTSQKLSVRFGETIKRYLMKNKDTNELKAIPLVFAGWLRYLIGISDSLEPFSISPDPLLSKLDPIFTQIEIGKTLNLQQVEQITELLKDSHIFGVNLVEIGLAPKILELFEAMISQKDSVRLVLKKQLD